jgi:hypothetical protein
MTIAMLGTLTSEQVDELLSSQMLGRIGCIVDGRPYVVPITYAYDSSLGCVYAHASEGAKIRAMRANPRVCFEVEQIQDMANWRTVIAFGEYEELGADNAEYGMTLIARQLASASQDRRERAHRLAGVTRNVLFRIRLVEKTGRYEIG